MSARGERPALEASPERIGKSLRCSGAPVRRQDNIRAEFPLTRWSGPPMILIRPRCDDDWLSFTNTEQTIKEGYRAAKTALSGWHAYIDQEGGIFPRRHVDIEVSRDRCIGCGLCAALAPNIMGLDASGKAFARTRIVEWSPADGDFVPACPTNAIIARTIRDADLPKVELAS